MNMTLKKAIAPLSLAVLMASQSSVAGLPKSATLVEKGVANHGEVYRTYAIKCANNFQGAYVTSWGAERKWCEGRNGSRQNCSIKKNKVAKNVCGETSTVSSL